MKTKSKALLASLCAVMLVVASVMGTMAYLTDTKTVTNTFTVGDVQIKLDEAKVDEYGKVDPDAPRVQANSYKLIPGHEYTKDPTVTVLADSEESYVRMMVTVNFSEELDAIFDPAGANLTSIFDGFDKAKWDLKDVTKDVTDNTRTYEFRYTGTVKKAATDTVLEPLFKSINIPSFINNEQLATLVKEDSVGNIDQFKITIEAHAIQVDGFDSDDAAWKAFDAQLVANK